MHTLAIVLAFVPAAVLAQSPLWGQCMLTAFVHDRTEANHVTLSFSQ